MSVIEEEEEIAGVVFDADFHLKLVSLLVRDTTFGEKCDGLVTPDIFEMDADKAIVGLVQKYREKYGKSPSFGVLPSLVKDALLTRSLRKDLLDPIRDRLRTIHSADISDREFVLDQVSVFAKERAVEEAILASVEHLKRRDYSKIEGAIRAALEVGVTDDIAEYDYFERIKQRTARRVGLATGTIKYEGISTGYADLDKHLHHRGWGRKELSVIMGAAKAGKSMSLGEFGKNASLLGYNVLYATLEVSAEIIGERLDANVADTAMRSLIDRPHDVAKKVEAAQAKAGVFKIVEYPSGTMKASQLRRVIERYRSRGIIFDMVIVDYADIMAPEFRSNDLRDDMRNIYIDLRGVASRYNVALLTATQTNREGAKAAVAKMTDVAEDFNKIRTADLVISINASDAEKAAGEARLFFAASRNSEGEFSLAIKQDRERMKFITKVIGRV